MKTVPIGDVTEPIETWNPRRSSDCTFDYIDLSAVDNSLKAIVAATKVKNTEAASRARQLVDAGDVLVSTVRPNLNAVAAVPIELQGATASTGFTVLRPGARIEGRYLFHWVTSPGFISEMVRRSSGASYPAVSDRIVRESLVPLPALAEQRRIAMILDHADALRAKRRQVLTHLDTLTQSIFHQMFGNEASSATHVRFGDIARLSGGRNLVADDSRIQSEYRVLRISAVTTGRFKAGESKPLPTGYIPPENHVVRPGDLLMSRANTTDLVGAVAYVNRVPANLALPDKIWRFDWLDSDSVPVFYQALFRTQEVRRRISRLASGTGGSMKNVSKAKLKEMPLLRVPIAKQKQFAERAVAVDALRDTYERKGLAHDELFASLQARAFNGEL